MTAVGLFPIANAMLKAIHRMSWTEYVTRTEEMRGVYRILLRKLEEKKPVGRPRRRLEDNTKKDIQEEK
jgi:hypothetical protein